MRKERIVFTIPAPLNKILREFCTQKDITMSVVLYNALDEYLSKRVEKPKPQKAVNPPKEPKPEKPKERVVSCANCAKRYNLFGSDGCPDCSEEKFHEF